MSYPTITALATLDRSTVGTLLAEFEREMRAKPRRVCVDLGAVETFDSAGLGGVVTVGSMQRQPSSQLGVRLGIAAGPLAYLTPGIS